MLGQTFGRRFSAIAIFFWACKFSGAGIASRIYSKSMPTVDALDIFPPLAEQGGVEFSFASQALGL